MTFYPRFWRRHFLGVELGLSSLLALCLLLWCHFAGGDEVLAQLVKNNRASVYGTLSSLFGSLLGFIITAMSVVLGFSESDRFKILRESESYRQLWAVFTSTIRYLGATTLAWLVALFFDRDGHERPVLLLVGVAFSLIASVRMARCVWALERVVALLTTKPK